MERADIVGIVLRALLVLEARDDDLALDLREDARRLGLVGQDGRKDEPMRTVAAPSIMKSCRSAGMSGDEDGMSGEGRTQRQPAMPALPSSSRMPIARRPPMALPIREPE